MHVLEDHVRERVFDVVTSELRQLQPNFDFSDDLLCSSRCVVNFVHLNPNLTIQSLVSPLLIDT